MANVSWARGSENLINELISSYQDGQMLLSKDTQKLFADINGVRYELNNTIRFQVELSGAEWEPDISGWQINLQNYGSYTDNEKSIILVAPTENCQISYNNYKIRALEGSDNYLTFVSEKQPSQMETFKVDIVIIQSAGESNILWEQGQGAAVAVYSMDWQFNESTNEYDYSVSTLSLNDNGNTMASIDGEIDRTQVAAPKLILNSNYLPNNDMNLYYTSILKSATTEEVVVLGGEENWEQQVQQLINSGKAFYTFVKWVEDFPFGSVIDNYQFVYYDATQFNNIIYESAPNFMAQGIKLIEGMQLEENLPENVLKYINSGQSIDVILNITFTNGHTETINAFRELGTPIQIPLNTYEQTINTNFNFNDKIVLIQAINNEKEYANICSAYTEENKLIVVSHNQSSEDIALKIINLNDIVNIKYVELESFAWNFDPINNIYYCDVTVEGGLVMGDGTVNPIINCIDNVEEYNYIYDADITQNGIKLYSNYQPHSMIKLIIADFKEVNK